MGRPFFWTNVLSRALSLLIIHQSLHASKKNIIEWKRRRKESLVIFHTKPRLILRWIENLFYFCWLLLLLLFGSLSDKLHLKWIFVPFFAMKSFVANANRCCRMYAAYFFIYNYLFKIWTVLRQHHLDKLKIKWFTRYVNRKEVFNSFCAFPLHHVCSPARSIS